MNFDVDDHMLVLLDKSLGGWCCEDCRLKFKTGRHAESVSKAKIPDYTVLKTCSLSDDIPLNKSTLPSFAHDSGLCPALDDNRVSPNILQTKLPSLQSDSSIHNQGAFSNIITSESDPQLDSLRLNTQPLNHELRSGDLQAMHSRTVPDQSTAVFISGQQSRDRVEDVEQVSSIYNRDRKFNPNIASSTTQSGHNQGRIQTLSVERSKDIQKHGHSFGFYGAPEAPPK